MDDYSRRFYKELLDNLYEGVYFVDRDRRVTYWNKSAESITGYPASFAVGKRCRDNFLNHITENGVELCNANCPLAATMQDGQKREAEVYLRHADGHRVPVEVRSAPIYNEKGEIVGAVESFSNNAILLEARRRARLMQRAALTDPLTGVANRRRIESRIKGELILFQETGSPFGALFCDIDHFKKINDQYGHAAGDAILKMIAQTLQNNVRSSDEVGRWGGEEFVVVVENMDLSRLKMFAAKLGTLIAQSRLDFENNSLAATISIGGTIAMTGDTLDSLIRRADALMYQSKKAGRNRATVE